MIERDKQELLDARADDLRRYLEAWVQTTLAQGQQDQLVVNISITTKFAPPRIVIRIKQAPQNPRRAVFLDSTLTQKDWSTIKALPWNDKQRVIINSLEESGNQMLNRNMGGPLFQSINVIFRITAKQYRLRKSQPYSHTNWWDSTFCIYHVR